MFRTLLMKSAIIWSPLIILPVPVYVNTFKIWKTEFKFKILREVLELQRYWFYILVVTLNSIASDLIDWNGFSSKSSEVCCSSDSIKLPPTPIPPAYRLYRHICQYQTLQRNIFFTCMHNTFCFAFQLSV